MLKGRDTAIGYLQPEINSGTKVQTAQDLWNLIKSGAVLGRKPQRELVVMREVTNRVYIIVRMCRCLFIDLELGLAHQVDDA